MRVFMYAIYDSCSKVYDRPWVARSDGEAMRSFGDIANDVSHPIGKHPEHFSCFCVGMFDDNTGEITPENPRCIGRAHELVRNLATGRAELDVDEPEVVPFNAGGSA